jgi:hypothetical protein
VGVAVNVGRGRECRESLVIHGHLTPVRSEGRTGGATAGPDEERDETLEVPADKEGSHPARPAIAFQHHTQAGNRERIRSFPASIKRTRCGQDAV